ncbi:MAG: alpha/beta hydrolase [Firmicutes bacterium]|nr:alpha/beta hydrolase [Bacillota bacterium]
MSLKKKILLGATAVLIVLAAACGIYINDYYHAVESAQRVAATFAADHACMEGDETLVFLPKDDEGNVKDCSGGADAGLIFYPGGKVEYTAYAPLMQQISEEGVLCILIKMPANLAVLDIRAAEGHREEFPEIEHWYVGGHSLGGSMAASYAAEHAHELEGLLLLAAYSTADLTASGLDVLTIYGSEDGVLNMSKYDEYRQNLPEETTTELVIKGGNHAKFGDYGIQDGDGTGSISRLNQQRQTAEAFVEILLSERGGQNEPDGQEE